MSGRLAVREARLPEEEPYFRHFIDGLQAFERQMEPNRRIDAEVGGDYLAVLLDQVAEKSGRVFVAVDDRDMPLGWAVALIEQDEVYTSLDWRTYGLISELYVDDAARGMGGGAALIAACEDYFRSQDVTLVSLGVLWGNVHARAVYDRLGYAPTSLRMRKLLPGHPV
jgi:GNAT superfamily N-acetyltransferase